ncbi:hypothetical protein DSL72_008861 [Monilinia vaccinii-corymbosi]|uniref:Rhodopsin domain-containing protein n=1 Tax=Monilinia vaccinii-corymbosi TaxID=61207 RepID=A0A8A3PQE2_9HELO|nr:hypothetical protein DSL72_008861 [Monilinia vaccinii-corymbosi]
MIQSALHVAHTAYAVTGIVFLLACTRFVLRRLKNERIYPDDWLMIVALLLLIENTSTFPVLFSSSGDGSIAFMDDEGISETELDKKIIFVSRITHVTYIWLLKACILIYYYRLTARQPEQRYVITASWGTACTWTITMLLWMLECRPFNLNWQIADPPPKCANGVSAGELGWFLGPLLVRSYIPKFQANIHQVNHCDKYHLDHYPIANDLANSDGHMLVVISVMRTIMQESGSDDPNDKFFWGELECLGMAFFANAPIINALYCRYKNGPVSNNLASRSARNTDDVEFCSVEDSREMCFMEALRAFEPESMKESGQGPIKNLPPAKLAPSTPNLGEPRRKAISNANMLLSVSRSRRGGQRDSLHCLQSVEVVQESEPADPNNPMTPNALGGVGRVETKIYHHDDSPLPRNTDLLEELYSSAHRSMTFEDILVHGPPRKN